jgi:hypothetical protein
VAVADSILLQPPPLYGSLADPPRVARPMRE